MTARVIVRSAADRRPAESIPRPVRPADGGIATSSAKKRARRGDPAGAVPAARLQAVAICPCPCIWWTAAASRPIPQSPSFHFVDPYPGGLRGAAPLPIPDHGVGDFLDDFLLLFAGEHVFDEHQDVLSGMVLVSFGFGLVSFWLEGCLPSDVPILAETHTTIHDTECSKPLLFL